MMKGARKRLQQEEKASACRPFRLAIFRYALVSGVPRRRRFVISEERHQTDDVWAIKLNKIGFWLAELALVSLSPRQPIEGWQRHPARPLLWAAACPCRRAARTRSRRRGRGLVREAVTRGRAAGRRRIKWQFCSLASRIWHLSSHIYDNRSAEKSAKIIYNK